MEAEENAWVGIFGMDRTTACTMGECVHAYVERPFGRDRYLPALLYHTYLYLSSVLFYVFKIFYCVYALNSWCGQPWTGWTMWSMASIPCGRCAHTLWYGCLRGGERSKSPLAAALLCQAAGVWKGVENLGLGDGRRRARVLPPLFQLFFHSENGGLANLSDRGKPRPSKPM